LILVTQPPLLPPQASREAIRDGARPPFLEEAHDRISRLAVNRYLNSLAVSGVDLIDIESLFTDGTGAIRFTDSQGHQLFEDPRHISGFGAELVKDDIISTIRSGAPKQ
jgi:hypothetical protein